MPPNGPLLPRRAQWAGSHCRPRRYSYMPKLQTIKIASIRRRPTDYYSRSVRPLISPPRHDELVRSVGPCPAPVRHAPSRTPSVSPSRDPAPTTPDEVRSPILTTTTAGHGNSRKRQRRRQLSGGTGRAVRPTHPSAGAACTHATDQRGHPSPSGNIMTTARSD
jgi:hypothetical protein